ncbi:MAG: CBS domain-containing protein [Kofleriaceae bacterium]|nr:CBS domain-containing protein [Kofleriaceae bacterium]MCL4227553.1 CBS domain-containing protein [Myxococcales bacterium]
MKISKLMHTDVITCRAVDDVDRAAQLMWEHDIGALPVVDEEGHVAGMITDRDICMAAFTQGVPLRAIPVSVAMSRRVYTCSPDDTVAEAERAMAAHQVRRMPVIDAANHPVGIISVNDLARASQQKNGVPVGEVASTLAAIGVPRPLITGQA